MPYYASMCIFSQYGCIDLTALNLCYLNTLYTEVFVPARLLFKLDCKLY